MMDRYVSLLTQYHMDITDVASELQNAEYNGSIASVGEKTVRFRTAKITPKKIGQFVSFWEKGEDGKNQPYTIDTNAELLVIHVFSRDSKQFGQFVFPKDILVKKGILSSDKASGKMAMRVYPSWDQPTSKQALATQKWQSPYFFTLHHLEGESLRWWIDLYKIKKPYDTIINIGHKE